MTELVTRYVGTCIVCERHIKVRDGFLVHHGFRRPGTGYIEGDCFGVEHKPHETSVELAEAYLELLESTLKVKEKVLVSNKDRLIILKQEFEKLCNTDSYSEKYKTEQVIRLLEHEISELKLHIRRIKGHIDSWSLKPLITFDEEKQIQQMKKDEIAKRKADKKRDKLNLEIKRFQERIDSAYKRNNKEALANLYESIMRKLGGIDNTLSKQNRMRLIDRENIWKELGVYKDDLYCEDSWTARDIITKG